MPSWPAASLSSAAAEPRRLRLYGFHGGLSLPGHKAPSTARGLQACALPAQLRVPLLQHAGEPAQPCVAMGERLRRGQLLARAHGEVFADIRPATTFVVTGLLDPSWKVEIEAEAVIG